jgi:hypothetical protein
VHVVGDLDWRPDDNGLVVNDAMGKYVTQAPALAGDRRGMAERGSPGDTALEAADDVRLLSIKAVRFVNVAAIAILKIRNCFSSSSTAAAGLDAARAQLTRP